MITVNYSGRLGNNLFQLIFGKIIAERTGYKLQTNPEKFLYQEEFQNLQPNNSSNQLGRETTGQTLVFDDTVNKTLTLKTIIEKIELNSDKRIMLNGFWQKWDFYKNHLSQIRTWLKLTDCKLDIPINRKDVILHFRRDDYLESGSQLEFGYYHEILNSFPFGKIYIIGDIDSAVNQEFSRYNPITIDADPIETLRFIKQFNNIIMSNSTFIWWGALLSNASNIFYPEPETGYWSRSQDQRLFVPGMMKKYINIRAGVC